MLAYHPLELLNLFDPATLHFFWAGLDAAQSSTFISLGNTTNSPGVPFDRIVALQNTDPLLYPPGDPIFVTTINWEGTFAVTKGLQVPESGSSFVAATMGLGALFLFEME